MVEIFLLNVSRCCGERKYYKENFQSMLHMNPNNYGQDIRVSPDPNILNKKWFHHNFLNFDLIPIFPAKIAPDPHGLQIWPLCQIGTKQNVPWTWEHGKVVFRDSALHLRSSVSVTCWDAVPWGRPALSLGRLSHPGQAWPFTITITISSLKSLKHWETSKVDNHLMLLFIYKT